MKAEVFEVTYKGERYDIGNFIKRHPGGAEILLQNKDKDITTAFDHIGHSNDAKFLLKKRKIKPLSQNNSTNSLASKETENQTTHNSDEEIDENFDSKKFIVKKLFTEEDKYNTHKILGLLALTSYIYRYCYVLPTTGKLGMGHDYLTYFTLALHMLLSCSSFIFHVLKYRIVENPLIIYEEYRLHAIVFTFRGVFVALFGLFVDFIPEKLQLVFLISGITIVHLKVIQSTIK